jgi:uncharacterized membrane protein
VVDTWIGKLKGKDRHETLENYSILFIFIGALILSFGIAFSVVNQRVSAIVSILGAWVAFISTAAFIFIWVLKEFRSD